MERINLQMFAEEGQNEEPNVGAAEPAAKTYTEDELNARINEVVQQKKAQWDKAREREISEAEKLAKMTEEEKSSHRINELEAELKALRAEKTLGDMTKTARGILKHDGINVPDELLAVLVSEDAEKTNKAVSAFSTLFTEAVKTAALEAIKTGAPPKSSPSKGLTKEEIMKVADRRERQKLIAENIELFTGGTR